MRAFVEKRLAWLIAAALLGCGGDSEEGASAQYALSQEIPLGVVNLSVTRWEEVRGSSSPLRSLRPPQGEKPIAVFVRWSGLAEYADFDRRAFVEAFLSDRLTLVDSDGFEYAALTAMPEALYHFPARAGAENTAPDDWAIIFWTWVDSRGYELRIEYPEPGGGAFDVAVVDLP